MNGMTYRRILFQILSLVTFLNLNRIAILSICIEIHNTHYTIQPSNQLLLPIINCIELLHNGILFYIT